MLDSSAGPSARGARRALDACYTAMAAMLRRHHNGAGPRPGGAQRWTLAWQRSSTMDRGTGNKRGVLTDDEQAVDRGRRPDFGSSRHSSAVVLGYRREGESGMAPLLGLQRLSCVLYGGDRDVRRSTPGTMR
jgi:hypothetical protein